MDFMDIYHFPPSFLKPETTKLFPENLVTYKLFGEPHGPHYAHYDLVGGRLVSMLIENRVNLHIGSLRLA